MPRISGFSRLLGLVLLATSFAVLSCGKKEQRGGSGGTAAKPDDKAVVTGNTDSKGKASTNGPGTGGTANGGAQSGEEGAGTSNGGTSDSGTNGAGGCSQDPSLSKTAKGNGAKFDACVASGNPWIGAVNSSPSICGQSKLTTWCCSKTEVLRRFPSAADRINSAVTSAEGKGLKLYHCSTISDTVYLHFAKVSGSSVNYSWSSFCGYDEVQDTSGTPATCPAVTFADIGGTLGSTTGTTTGGTTTGGGTTGGETTGGTTGGGTGGTTGGGTTGGTDLNLQWENDINPIIKASCGGGSCHGAGSPFGVYVDSPATVKTAATKFLNRLQTTNDMPPAYATPEQALSPANEKKIVDYINAVK
jgi:hypothetical protein